MPQALRPQETTVAKILIVDDDLSFRSMMGLRFADAGYDVETAANGSQVLEKTEEILKKPAP